jgi:hypothetical protein
MTNTQRVAILFPADPTLKIATRLEQSRFAETAAALRAAGIDVIGAPYADDIVDEVRHLLRSVDGVLVWHNPVEGGRDRSQLNAMLREIAARGAFVSTHPEAIDRIGTKDVLFRTRTMSWGSDTRLYQSIDAMRPALAESLASGPRVLKQIRGQSGDGVWLVQLAEPKSQKPNPLLRVRHAKRGSPEEVMPFETFMTNCVDDYFAAGDIIDQVYQPRLTEGMVRCYLVRDRVAGFGEQLINMLYPAPDGGVPADAPLPGPRLYFPPTRADFQPLKLKLENGWVDEMCEIVGLAKSQLPVLWDADFLYGPKDASGADTHVLCEINVSSVYPFPPSALGPLVAETVARVQHRAL